jgi:hypothetical protein
MGVGSHLDHTHTFFGRKNKATQLACPFKQIAPSTKFTFYSLWDCTTTPYWLALEICYVYWEEDKSIQHIWNATWIVNIFTLLSRHDYNSYLTTMTPTTWMAFFCFIRPQMASPFYLDWMANWHRDNLNIVGCNIACFLNVLCVTSTFPNKMVAN